jgi:hypothetical protein
MHLSIAKLAYSYHQNLVNRMISLDGMPTVADGITAKKWWWRRVSIDDPSFR